MYGNKDGIVAQSYYRVTYPGLMFSLYANEVDMFRSFLLYFVARHASGHFSINEIKEYFDQDNRNAVKAIYHLLKMGWIDVCDHDKQDSEAKSVKSLHELLMDMPDECLILSDSSGLPVLFSGFSKHEAACIAALACEFVKPAMKSIRLSGVSTQEPVVFSFDWNNTILQSILFYVGKTQLCISIKTGVRLSQDKLFRIVSCLAGRYS